MPSAVNPAVVLHDLSFAWPDGSVALSGVSGSFGRGRTGLTGLNGAGKSTLLRLVGGRLRPSSGGVVVSGTADYLPQRLTLDTGTTVAGLLGVREQVDAVRAIAAGDTRPELFDVVGDGWDAEERAVAALGAAGLPADPDRTVGTLSGGEAMLTAVVGLRLRGADVALLDEPTNNLDGDSRERLYDLVRGWRGTLVVVSHDLALLELMDATAELRDGTLTTFGGPFSEYRAWLAVQQEAAEQALRAAEQTLRREKRQRIELEERVAHSERQARKDRANRRYVPAVVRERKNAAERSQGDRRGLADDRIAAAQAAVDASERAVRDDERVVVDLPDPQVPAGRRLAVLTGSDGREHVIQGPERVALTGPNGAGKTTLLERLAGVRGGGGGTVPAASGTTAGAASAVGLPAGAASGASPGPANGAAASGALLTDRVAYLPQRVDVLDDDATVLDAVRAGAPEVPPGELRNRLARFLVRGAAVHRTVATLSGGERFRVALARLLLADPPAQLLILDEPTNNLDVATVDQLVAALTRYRGALLVVSHDRAFLERLDLTRELRLDPDGRLFEVA
ncbi:ABC-F family ATP-binding cassette domain-containing protein [Myceligenerans crystallogenes]|uniref:ATP-binding cassette domain-containing protein n=1 Tax=Myceligenerans crystallogenes TaxID=316335 RepID=A0ABN2NJ32_9MICO